MAESMKGLKRSVRCGEVTQDMIGQTLTLMGWTQKRRNLGSLIFVDLRDRSGIMQILFDENVIGTEGFAKAGEIRSEFVLAVTGVVQKRGGAVNEKLKTGTMELCATGLRILSESEECGIYAISDLHGRQFFITGHSEYDKDTLDREYRRDMAAGLKDVDIPKNYYIDDDPSKGPILRWRSSATLMYTNWLNYYVYQETPFDINLIKSIRNEDLEPNRDLEKNG